MSGGGDYYNERMTWRQHQEAGAKESDPVSREASTVAAPPLRPQRLTMLTLACLWALLVGLAIAWVVFYASNRMKKNECDTAGTGPKSAANSCMFPFIYGSRTYHTCTSDGRLDGKLWCATTGNYNADSEWAFCPDVAHSGFFNESAYYFPVDKLTWEQSQYACIRDGGHLVIIESQQEQDFIRRKVGNEAVKNSYWIGMTDSKVEGTWVWMDNTTLNNNIKYWDQNNGTENSTRPEPNDWPPGEDCAQMGQRCSGQISCWIDTACDTLSKRICESRRV